MTERGGPTTESGIFFQNQVAALYLGRLIDPRPRPGYAAVVEVRLEAPPPVTVDDIVIRFGDGHGQYIQVKESVAAGSGAWAKLWKDFATQRAMDGFTVADGIMLLLGSHQAWVGTLRELGERAAGANGESEWRGRLGAKHRKLLESLQPILADHLEGQSPFALFACCEVEIWDPARITTDQVPNFMPPSNVEPLQLYETLLRKTSQHARIRKAFTEEDLLQELAQERIEILGGTGRPLAGAPPTIPPPTRDFAGRTDELEELRRAVGEHGGALIYGVRGLGGIGKTQLGLKLVELVGNDYPDGHILVELGGASEHPLSSADAMASVIRAYEPQLRLPEAEEDLRRMYHQVLKDRRAIVLLDDAAGAEQVEPLLPYTGCLTLVTSRQRFALQKLRRLNLDALTLKAARELLLSLAPRLGGEAERIAELLGRLPQALRLAGSAFAERPDLEPEEYVRRLENRDERVGLVEAAISFNYEALTPEHKRLWRTLAVFPGDFDVAGAAAVWAAEADVAQEVLGGGLYSVSLVEWRGGRCRLHDLARDFAASRLEEEERQTAARRHAGHYIEVLKEADRLYSEEGESILGDLALFDTEWHNIRVGQAWATERSNDDREAVELRNRYAGTGTYCLHLRLPPAERISWLEAGRSAASLLGDRRREGAHLGMMGVAYRQLGELRSSIRFQEQALAIAREIGDRQGEGNALGNLGVAYHNLGDLDQAIRYCEQWLVIARKIGDRSGESKALGNLGLAYADLGEFERAISYHEQALPRCRETGDRSYEGLVLGNLGNAYYGLAEAEKSIGYYEQARSVACEIGDRFGEGGALGNLANAYADLGEFEKSIGYYEQALLIDREIGDRHGEGAALSNLGSAYADLGEVAKAIAHLEQALAIGQAIKAPRIVSICSEQLDRLRKS